MILSLIGNTELAWWSCQSS